MLRHDFQDWMFKCLVYSAVGLRGENDCFRDLDITNIWTDCCSEKQGIWALEASLTIDLVILSNG